MRRAALVLVVLVGVFGLAVAGCGGEEEASPAETVTGTLPTETTTETTETETTETTETETTETTTTEPAAEGIRSPGRRSSSAPRPAAAVTPSRTQARPETSDRTSTTPSRAPTSWSNA